MTISTKITRPGGMAERSKALAWKASVRVKAYRGFESHSLRHYSTYYMHSGDPKDSVRLRVSEMMGKHYELFTHRIEAVAPERLDEVIVIQLVLHRKIKPYF